MKNIIQVSYYASKRFVVFVIESDDGSNGVRLLKVISNDVRKTIVDDIASNAIDHNNEVAIQFTSFTNWSSFRENKFVKKIVAQSSKMVKITFLMKADPVYMGSWFLPKADIVISEIGVFTREELLAQHTN
jgi:hypothetical protein